MFECFLLLRSTSGARWIPLLAIPMVIAGGIASVSLMLSGAMGILAARRWQNRVRVTAPRSTLITPSPRFWEKFELDPEGYEVSSRNAVRRLAGRVTMCVREIYELVCHGCERPLEVEPGRRINPKM